MVDNSRGVWKAPANVSVNAVVRPAVTISDTDQEDLNLPKAQALVPGFLSWFADIQKILHLGTALPIPIPPTLEKKAPKGTYVMSGFRDKDISNLLERAGWESQERITKSTTVLVVPDDTKETGKVRDARAAGVRIVTRSEIKTLL
jgi:hypothetical protein